MSGLRYSFWTTYLRENLGGRVHASLLVQTTIHCKSDEMGIESENICGDYRAGQVAHSGIGWQEIHWLH